MCRPLRTGARRRTGRAPSLPGRRLRARRGRLHGHPVHGPRGSAAGQRPPRHRPASRRRPTRSRTSTTSKPRSPTEFCRWHNDELAAVVAGHPDRFRGFAQLPMQDIDAAIGRAAPGGRGPRPARRLHRHRLPDRPRRRAARPVLVDGVDARRPGVHPPCAGGDRRAPARPADPQVRPRPLRSASCTRRRWRSPA